MSAVVVAAAVSAGVLAQAAGAQQGFAGYSDVDDEGIHAPAIAALASEGLLEGTECSTGMFCPADTLPRWIMAVWLVRAVDGGDPPSDGAARFDDVDADAWWTSHTERLAELGITKGCSTEPLRYCPDRPVTRGEMASFLTRALDLQRAEPAGFTDIEGSTHESDINALAAVRITAGCSRTPLLYCPQRHVTRAEMATFLARALGLVPLPEPPPDLETPSVTAVLYTSDRGGIWIAELDGSGPTKISDGWIHPPGDLYGDVAGGLSLDRKHLYYTTYDGPNREVFHGQLWVTVLDGSRPQSTARIASDAEFLDFSPDGKHLVFRKGGLSKNGSLWVANADGTSPVKLPGDQRFGFARFCGWSSDGDHLAYDLRVSDGPSTSELRELWVASADGTNPISFGKGRCIGGRHNVHGFEHRTYWNPEHRCGNIFSLRLCSGQYSSTTWSPDGNRLIYARQTDYVDNTPIFELWTKKADGTSPIKLNDDGRTFEGWSPGGMYVIYGHTHGTVLAASDGTFELSIESTSQLQHWAPDDEYFVILGAGGLMMYADRANPVRLIDINYAAVMAWSPDGNHFAYYVPPHGVGPDYIAYADVGLADIDGTNHVRLGSHHGALRHLHNGYPNYNWSPDGRYFYYRLIGEDGEWGPVWVTEADGSNQIRLTTNRGHFNGFSPNGESISYSVVDDAQESWQSWVAAADGSNAVRIPANGEFDFNFWSPDGDRFAYRVREEDGRPDVWVADADGSNSVQIAEFGTWSAVEGWSPDSKYLLLSVYDDKTRSSRWVVAADGSNPVELTVPRGIVWSPRWLTG